MTDLNNIIILKIQKMIYFWKLKGIFLKITAFLCLGEVNLS